MAPSCTREAAIDRGRMACACPARRSPRSRRAGLTLGDVTLLAVGLGPGPFTGLRVGLATIEGLPAFATGLPVVGVSRR